MEPERFDEELGRLRDAWRSSQPARESSGELEHEDAATRASVEWMRRAWKEVVLSATDRPSPQVQRLSERVAPTRLLLAAAALVAASTFLWVWLERRESHEPRRSDVATVPLDARVDLEPDPAITEPVPEVRPRVEAIGRELLVLRSGPVRLYLATGSGALTDPRNLETH